MQLYGELTNDAISVSHPRYIQDAIRYHLLREVAHGGMGVVYEAEQLGAGGFSKKVAIKLIREEFSTVESFQRNFIGEARLVSGLVHPNIVQIYQLGENLGQYYMVMEWVNGNDLETLLERLWEADEPFPLEWACFVVSRICRGLDYAHNQRDARGRPLDLVHRDVNPRNILLSHEGDIKLTDFGVAKALNLMFSKEREVIAGNDDYLSPEQAQRRITDRRSDVFACGVLLAEMIAGFNIFAADTPEQTRENICTMRLPDFRELRPDIPDELIQITRRALERDRDARFPTASEMMTALEWYLYRDGYGPTHEKFAIFLERWLKD